MQMQQIPCSRTTFLASNPNPKPEAWILRVFGHRKPLGFQAGDSNLYRYVANSPTTGLDPSGLQNGVNNHSYPLHLGGSGNQPVIELYSQADHVAFHRYFTQHGFGYGPEGRAAWARLTVRQQQAHIIRAMRAARVPNSVIRQTIGRIMGGANPGVLTPRPPGFPGGVIRLPVLGAVGEILLNPGVASAAEIDRRWHGLAPNLEGTAELGIRIVYIDQPRVWNMFPRYPGGNVVRTEEPEEWENLGQMTVAEARQLEGMIESREWVPGTFGSAADDRPSGYWREVRVYVVIRFSPGRGGGDVD